SSKENAMVEECDSSAADLMITSSANKIQDRKPSPQRQHFESKKKPQASRRFYVERIIKCTKKKLYIKWKGYSRKMLPAERAAENDDGRNS
uniref:Chromo domain-containing protein n=1 Tax=Macrostomum lignano TaxID=282301 RepID=A0A1I8JL65_9PLAT